jgi:hypothetical protein
LTRDAQGPATSDDVLRYQPMPNGLLVVDVPHLLRPVNGISSRSRFPEK